MRLGLEDFLRRHSVSLEHVRSRVEDDIGVDAGDAVFLAGSLVESLGHARSDLDIYLLTDRSVACVGERRAVECETAPIDLELWPWDHVEHLLASLDAMPADAPRDPRDSLIFSEEDREFLHRLSVGVPLAREDRVRAIAKRVDQRRLARVLFDRACARIGTAQADLVGLLEIGDFDTVPYLIRMVAECVAGCVLAATGETNPEAKWRLAKLERLVGTCWDADLPGGPILPDISTQLRRLLYPTDTSTAATVTLAHECIRLANRVIPWGQERFLSRRDLRPPPATPTDATRSDRQARLSDGVALYPQMSPDIHIRYEPDQYQVYPFEGGRVVSVNRLFVEAFILYDGATSKPDIVAHLGKQSLAAEADLASAVDDIETFLLGERLLVPAESA